MAAALPPHWFPAGLGVWGPLQHLAIPARGVPTPIWRRLHLVAALGLVLRLATALWSERVHHPDEIFQYLEQAHRLVFGYGYVPWEYRYGVRNWLLAGGVACILETLQWMGITSPSAYIPIVKCVAAALSVTVIYSVYFIGRALYDDATGRLASVFAALWYELIYVAALLTPEVLCGYAALGAMALLCAVDRPTVRRWLAIGILLGLIAALRLQFLPVVGMLTAILALQGGWRACGLAAAGASLPLVIAGALDAWFWGAPFASFYYNFLYNSVYQVASLFGQTPALFYVQALGTVSAGIFFFAMLAGFKDWRRSAPVLVLIAAIVLPHSLIPHKEYRFIFGCTAWFLLLTARLFLRAVPQAISALRPRGAAKFESLIVPVGIGVVFVVSIVGSFARLPGQWLLLPNAVYLRDDFLRATIDLASRSHVVAVANVYRPWWETGGYFYLHHKVPIYDASHLAQINMTADQVASHILCAADAAPLADFQTVARYGAVEVRERIHGQALLLPDLRPDALQLAQPGVTDRFTPLVTPRL